MSLLNHGLSALMEACKQSERAESESDALFEAFEEAVDDDIKACLMDDDPDLDDEDDYDDDSVEADMVGKGTEDDDKIAELLKHIPPSDEDVEDQIEALSESVIPSDELEYL